MKNLARHIELLLRDNDCVILPDFGGFIAHDVPAYYVAEEGLYYPPSRSISFNAAIKMNDGLLVQSYMKSYQVDYARANYMIDVAIEELTDQLDEEGHALLPHIGTITQDIHQSLLFTPDPAGISSPAHFGLGSFSIKALSQLHQPTEAQPTATRSAKAIDLHINKEMLHRVMSTAAVFLFLLMIALPTGIHRPTDIAALRLTELITATQIQEKSAGDRISELQEEAITANTTTQTESEEPVAESPVESIPAAVEPEQTVSAVEIPATIEEPAALPEPIAEEAPTATESVSPTEAPTAELLQSTVIPGETTTTYHIIVASLPNHRGADETLAQYINQGYGEASLVERDDRVRISLMKFTNKDEANEHLKALRQQSKFQSAWLLAVRN